MPPRLRRFIACFGVLAFLAFWTWGAVTLGEKLPDIMWVDLLFYGIAGTFWGIPLIPMLRWAEKSPKT